MLGPSLRAISAATEEKTKKRPYGFLKHLRTLYGHLSLRGQPQTEPLRPHCQSWGCVDAVATKKWIPIWGCDPEAQFLFDGHQFKSETATFKPPSPPCTGPRSWRGRRVSLNHRDPPKGTGRRSKKKHLSPRPTLKMGRGNLKHTSIPHLWICNCKSGVWKRNRRFPLRRHPFENGFRDSTGIVNLNTTSRFWSICKSSSVTPAFGV